jgi:hypothetical protein
MCVVICLALRPRLGDRAALLAALCVAVSPYLITYSNLGRGFMLADLALLVAVWALLSLADREAPAKWAAFVLACTVAVWTEYGSIIFVIALALGALWIGVPRRWPTALAGGVSVLTLAPWIPEVVRGQNQVGVTKFNPINAAASLHQLRDIVVTLALGENGGIGSAAGRWLELAVMFAVSLAAAVVLRRHWNRYDVAGQRTIQLLAATGLLAVVGSAAVALIGIHVFSQRYLTVLVPLAAALAAASFLAVSTARLTAIAAVALVAIGVGNVVRRFRGQWQPSLAPVGLAADSIHPRTVLTNTPVVLYYLRSFAPVMDRPYNIGPGRTTTCARPCLVIDDTRVPGGTPRHAVGTKAEIGSFLLTVEH